PRDVAFFDAARSLRLRRARVAAFGATRRRSHSCDTDPNIQALLSAGTSVVTIFGKSWELHVSDALRISSAENLELIEDSVRYLSRRVDMLVYDAEHFFDGYRSNPEYAVDSLRAAVSGGAQRIVLCDTNGGSLPEDVAEATRVVAQH